MAGQQLLADTRKRGVHGRGVGSIGLEAKGLAARGVDLVDGALVGGGAARQQDDRVGLGEAAGDGGAGAGTCAGDDGVEGHGWDWVVCTECSVGAGSDRLQCDWEGHVSGCEYLYRITIHVDRPGECDTYIRTSRYLLVAGLFINRQDLRPVRTTSIRIIKRGGGGSGQIQWGCGFADDTIMREDGGLVH